MINEDRKNHGRKKKQIFMQLYVTVRAKKKKFFINDF
jgi:hypothetical protein